MIFFFFFFFNVVDRNQRSRVTIRAVRMVGTGLFGRVRERTLNERPFAPILAYGTRARSARGSQNCAILSIIHLFTTNGAFWLSVNSVVVYLPWRKDATKVFFTKLTQINTL